MGRWGDYLKDLLTTTPRYDDATFYLRQWTLEVIQEAKKRGKTVLHLDEKDVTKAKFEAMVNSNKPKFILLNGHGSESEIIGQSFRNSDGGFTNTEKILGVGENEDITKDAIVYARACNTSSKLGKACVEKGAIAYIGYKGNFTFYVDANKETKPAEDKTANYFKEITNIIPLTILKGNTVLDAVERSKQMTIKIIDHLETSEYYDPVAQAILPFLYLDLMLLQVSGKENAKI